MSRVAFLSHCVSSLCPDSDGPLKAYHSPLYPPSFEPAPTPGVVIRRWHTSSFRTMASKRPVQDDICSRSARRTTSIGSTSTNRRRQDTDNEHAVSQRAKRAAGRRVSKNEDAPKSLYAVWYCAIAITARVSV